MRWGHFLSWMRSSQAWMRSSQVWMRSSQVWMKSGQVVRASGCQCQNRNSPGFDPAASSDTVEYEGAADEAVLNHVYNKKDKFKKIPLFYTSWKAPPGPLEVQTPCKQVSKNFINFVKIFSPGLGSIPESSDTVESEGRQGEATQGPLEVQTPSKQVRILLTLWKLSQNISMGRRSLLSRFLPPKSLSSMFESAVRRLYFRPRRVCMSFRICPISASLGATSGDQGPAPQKNKSNKRKDNSECPFKNRLLFHIRGWDGWLVVGFPRNSVDTEFRVFF